MELRYLKATGKAVLYTAEVLLRVAVGAVKVAVGLALAAGIWYAGRYIVHHPHDVLEAIASVIVLTVVVGLIWWALEQIGGVRGTKK